jgi:hypothetical protein
LLPSFFTHKKKTKQDREHLQDQEVTLPELYFNDDVDGKRSNFYWFLQANNLWTKNHQTTYCVGYCNTGCGVFKQGVQN